MTDKQFTIDYSDESIINTFTKQYYPTDDIDGVEDICELLNELHEENEDLATKKEDAEYELLHLKEMYEELLEEKEKYKKEMLYFKRELQKELVCQGGREKND